MTEHADDTKRARDNLSRGLEAEITKLRALRAPQRIMEIIFFAGLWAVGIVLGLWGLSLAGWIAWAPRLAGVAASAVALNAIYLLSHEGHHHLLFRSRAANHAANVALCAPLLHSPTAYRVLHDLHHRYLGGPGDPDEYRNITANPRLLWALHWVRLTLGTLVYMPLIPLVAWRRARGVDRWWIAGEYAGMAVLWVAVFSSVPLSILLQAWLVPGILVGYFSAVRALAQHALTEPHDPLLASRSVESNRFVSFLLLNENYHLEHHLFPEVPSYNLPRLRALLHPRRSRAVEGTSYTRFLLGFIQRSLRGDPSILGFTERANPGEVSR